MSWGENLRVLRVHHGLTQRELGEAIAAHLGEAWAATKAQHTVSRLERGVPMMSGFDAHRIAQALSGIFRSPVPIPPVESKAGAARHERRGGDAQREGWEPCPHCQGRGKVRRGGAARG